MNQWTDSIPEHRLSLSHITDSWTINLIIIVRWDPHRENSLFFHQSATLYASYYHLQILIHRPFIPGPRNPSAVSFPSLTICTNAARSCSHVFDTQWRRCVLPLPMMQVWDKLMKTLSQSAETFHRFPYSQSVLCSFWIFGAESGPELHRIHIMKWTTSTNACRCFVFVNNGKQDKRSSEFKNLYVIFYYVHRWHCAGRFWSPLFPFSQGCRLT